MDDDKHEFDRSQGGIKLITTYEVYLQQLKNKCVAAVAVPVDVCIICIMCVSECLHVWKYVGMSNISTSQRSHYLRLHVVKI